MKIAFLSPFYPYRGGIAQFSDSLYESLKKNHEVKAFSFKRQYPKLFFPGTSQFVLKDDIKRDVNAVMILDSINPLTYKKTAKRIIENKPDLVLISYWMPFFAPSLGCVAHSLKKKHLKIISILHNVIPHETRLGDRALSKFYMRQSRGFVILNEQSKYDLLSLKPDAKFIVHPHPLYSHYGNKYDINVAREKLTIPNDKKVVLFFGFIRDYKGLDLLIEAFNELDDSYLLLIVGEVYGGFEKYQQLIEKYSLQGRISLHKEYVPDADIPLYFSAADVCVLPYRSGTQSGIISIAYHFELPVITTDVGGLKEMVQDGKTGFIVPELSPKSISENIKKYFDPEAGFKSKFQKNIIEYMSYYSWDNFATALLEFQRNI
jgi:glycosyltransferase involved in cell wall biosynthesis